MGAREILNNIKRQKALQKRQKALQEKLNDPALKVQGLDKNKEEK